jgi:nickel-dependent lactate racemase
MRLNYGKDSIPIEFDKERFQVLGSEIISEKPLSDPEIGKNLESPIASKPIEELIDPKGTVLIVVPDATRKVGSGQILNLVVRRLIASGLSSRQIVIIIATGIHRPATEEEKKEILTPFIAQRIKTLNHSAVDLKKLAGLESNLFAYFGQTQNGIEIWLNKVLREFEHVILIGGVSFHYFAGFTGGRKLICPGLASAETISETHKLAFDFNKKDRTEGVGTGLLRGNIVHETFVEIAEKVNPTFSINTIVNEKGEIEFLFCGHWKIAHEKACEFYKEKYTIKIKEKRDFVVVSCGGFPFDLNMIQAHKALESASHACKDGGTIILLAECADGLGRADFLKWFDAENSEKLAEMLSKNYQVNGQTAWSLLKKTERFKVQILTGLSEEICKKMRMEKISELKIPKNSSGYIFPYGAKFLVTQSSSLI